MLVGSRNHNVEVFDTEGNIVEQNKIIYDFPAIILMMVLTGFAMCMAVVYWVWNFEGVNLLM